jgi:hypothetical protein
MPAAPGAKAGADVAGAGSGSSSAVHPPRTSAATATTAKLARFMHPPTDSTCGRGYVDRPKAQRKKKSRFARSADKLNHARTWQGAQRPVPGGSDGPVHDEPGTA